MTRLSVNVNKVAVLRNSRGGFAPDPVVAAKLALAAGCHGITVHPRPDQRHIRGADVTSIAAVLDGAEFNIEGNPFAPPRPGYPGLIELVRRTRPAQVTLVPDGDGQLTSDHGFDGDTDFRLLRERIREFKAEGCRVSLFVDVGCRVLERFAESGADRIEIYTGPYAAAFESGDFGEQLEACVATGRSAIACGLGVNAGHDLDQKNLGVLLTAAPWISEVSIGHALFSEALIDGLAETVHNYLAIIDESA
ncbi:MAG TPA: pyridoxine 5'-phosphate synthase [Dokdonella sp.]|uniref:pyridoxine 5'-phosphate synthase n=1 Tax=Dokdonella sp. TaxID=2291710 RepID=UPI002D800CA1|nr:pyridoxine 5'-phosphate synthase [Dokdonella sp.]HET9034523.1 pyridoxine 5'-phosphate synthase [Dokdonella sp.]